MSNRNTSALIVIGSFDMFSKEIFMANLARIRKNLPAFLERLLSTIQNVLFFQLFSFFTHGCPK
jgi:hypothetical protein